MNLDSTHKGHHNFSNFHFYAEFYYWSKLQTEGDFVLKHNLL